MATWLDMYFQNSASPLMEFLKFFHDHIMIVMTVIAFIAGYMMIIVMSMNFTFKTIINSYWIEMIWITIPALILILISLPSIKMLYLLETTKNPSVTIKTLGHQWYWSYEYSDFKNIEFESYMLPYNSESQFRLLDVDNRTVVPILSRIRFLISSSDVLHAWSVPSLSIKMDAVPGRLNQLITYIFRSGIYYGQCSEICGANHSFMPIVLEAIKMNWFIKWIMNF